MNLTKGNVTGAAGVLAEEIYRHTADLKQTWKTDANARKWVGWVLSIAIFVIFLAIIIDIARFLDLHHSKARFLALTYDRSLPELVMDAQALLGAGLSIMLFQRAGLRSFLFFAVVLAFIALDDFFSLHEQLGMVLVDMFAMTDSGSINAEARAELVVFAVMGMFFAPLVAWCMRAFTAADAAIFVIYGVIFALFVVFAAGVDLIHSAVENSIIKRLLGWVEDGGEIISIALLTSVIILQFRGRRFV